MTIKRTMAATMTTAVKPENREQPKPGYESKDGRHPAGSTGVRGDLEGLDLATLAIERRRKSVNDQRQNIGPHKGENETNESAGDRRANRHPVGAHEWDSDTKDRVSDDLGDWSDRCEWNDIALVQLSRSRDFGVDDWPFGPGRQQDLLHSLDEIHRELLESEEVTWKTETVCAACATTSRCEPGDPD